MKCSLLWMERQVTKDKCEEDDFFDQEFIAAQLSDPAFLTYLNALPELVKRGMNEGQFVCSRYEGKIAIGKTREEAVQNFRTNYPEHAVYMTGNICAEDLETYEAYYSDKQKKLDSKNKCESPDLG